MPTRRHADLSAAEAALRRGAWREARRVYAAALAVDETAEAREGLGWALHWLGRAEESLAERERAFCLYQERGERAAAARVAIGLSSSAVDLRGEAVARGWLERARELLHRQPASVVHGWLILYEGFVARLLDDDAATARRNARRAERIAEQCGDDQLRLLAGALDGLAQVTAGRVEAGMRRIDAATVAALAGEIHDLDSVAQTCCMLLYACERVHDYKRAAEWQRRIAGFCKRWKVDSLFDVCSTQHAAMLAGAGDWRRAETQLERAIRKLESERPLVLPDALVHLAELRRRQGREDEALAIVARIETRTEAMLTRARIGFDRGDAETAVATLERLLARKQGEKWVERAAALELLVRARLQRGERPAAEAAHRQLRANAGAGTPVMARAYERLAAGELAADAGEASEARDLYAEALDLFDGSTAPYEAAIARTRMAAALAAGGHPRAAGDELERAIHAFETLGAQRDRERARALREQLAMPVRSAPRTGTTPPLSAREREVLHLIADGLGDKQLASRLSLSQHTVHRHVANILRKLAAPSRSAAVAAAVRQGWL